MRTIGLLLKFLIFLPLIIIMTLGVLGSIAFGVVLYFLTGRRRRPQFKVYTSRDFQDAFTRPEVFTRPPMRDVTPRSVTQITNE